MHLQWVMTNFVGEQTGLGSVGETKLSRNIFNKFLHNDFLMSPFGKPYQTLVADFKPIRVNSKSGSFFPPEHTWLKIRPWKCLGRVNPM